MAPQATSHYIKEEDISEKDYAKIDELRKALGPELLQLAPYFDDKYSLLRWLYGWDFKISEIIPRFKQAAVTIKALNIVEQEVDNEDDFNRIIRSVTPCAEYFPGGMMGFDREGNAVCVQVICKAHPKTLVKCDRVSELFKMVMHECALTHFMIRRQEEKMNQKLGLRLIMDLEGFNMDVLYTPTLKIYLNLIRMMQDSFPDFTKAIYVINSPMMMSTVYNLVKPALAKQTQEKIQFLGKDWKTVLCNEIGGENIYERWGGTKVPNNGTDTGLLRMGGIAPEEMRYHHSKNPHHVDDEKLVKINIAARNKKEVKINVEKPGAKLHWFFVANNDIDFYIVKNDLEVWPKFRLTTEFVPEFGHVHCPSEGEYVLIFDNSYGTIFGKEVKFHAYVQYD